jgi:hypothetical protein
MAYEPLDLGNDTNGREALSTSLRKIDTMISELYSSNSNFIDFGALTTDIVPDIDSERDLGSPTNRWKDLYLSGNTIDLGGVTISATVDGSLKVSGNIIPSNAMIGFSDEVSGTVVSTDKKTLTFDPPLTTGWELEPTLKVGPWHEYLYYPDSNVITTSDATLDWNYSTGSLNSLTLINGGSYNLSEYLYGQGQVDTGFFYINPNPLEEYRILGVDEEGQRFSLLNEFTVGEPNTGFTVDTSTNTVTGSAAATGTIRGVNYEIIFGLKYVNNGEGLAVDDANTEVFVDGARKILASQVVNLVYLYWDGVEWKLAEYLESQYIGARVDVWFRFNKLQYLTSISPIFSSSTSSGPVTAIGNSSVSGDLSVRGDLTVDGDLYVSPNSLYLGNMHLSTDDNATLLINGTPVGTGSGNSFDQDLNTTNDVEFNSIASPTLTLVGDTQEAQDAYDDGVIQSSDLQFIINNLNSQINQKTSELSFWQGIASQGPSNPQYNQALSEINRLQSEIVQLQNQRSVTLDQADAVSDMLTYYSGVLSNSNLSPVVFDYLGQSITFDTSIKIPSTARIINSDGDVLLGSGHNANKFTTISVSGQSNISADSTSDTLTFAAGSGISITTNAASDIITITNTSQGGGSMATRTIVDGSTTSLTDGSTGSINITGFKGYVLYKVTTSAAAWVRIYTSNAARSADASRLEGVDPSPDSGVIAEIITTEAETVLISPGAFGFNDELTPTTNIPVAVTNKSGSTATVSVTLTVLQLEA